METLWQDLRYGVRMMSKNRSFTAVAIVTLALGIGANTAIFSVVDAVLLRSLPYPAADRLVMLWSTMQSQGVPTSGSALPDYREWRDQNQVFEGLGGFYYGDFNLSGENREPERVQGAFVTPNFFSVLGVAPAIGRGFLPEEEQFGRHRVVLLSHGLWQRRYGASPEIVGREIDLSGDAYTVAGVMPQGMAFLDNTPQVELWRPISFAPGDNMDSRNNHFVYLVGRLKPGVTLQQAQGDTSAIARNIEAANPENTGVGAQVVPLGEQLTGDTRTGLLVLLSAVGFVLLVACVNVANLLLARAASREKELAVRTSLGASRSRLIRQLMLESVPLGLIGGGAGLLLAMWGVDAIVSVLPPTLPRYNTIGIDSNVLVFTLVVSLLTISIFGLLPAFQATRSDVREGLSDGGRSVTAGRRRSRLRGMLVASEMALALVLLIGAGLMAQSFLKLRSVDVGFSPKNVVTMRIPLPESKYPVPLTPSSPPPVALNFYDQLLARVSSQPGVEAAGVSTMLPLGAGSGWGKFLSIEGRPAPSSLDQVPLVRFSLTSPDYLRAMGISVRKGRAFSEHDTADSQQVAIINETLARRFFADEDPIGKTIWMGPPESLLPADAQTPENQFVRREIVGVVADVKGSSLEKAPNPEALAPYSQNKQEGWSNALMLAVRTTASPQNAIAAIREQVRALDADQPITNVATMEERLSQSLSQPRFSTMLLGLFASVALLLAAVGIFGVMSYVVTQRTHEIGIRMALGARRIDVLKLVVGHGMRLTVIGLTIGLAASFALTRLMSSLLFGVSATDPLTFLAISMLLASVALLACYFPARRATKGDPMVALRYE
ncbi:MAG TPA: ABC transporter permease [Blastocatellia bacterium]|nr:ABC transporter permease [Blastocatellia bacterium]